MELPRSLRKNAKELRLYYRYACRRLGFEGYQVHQIRLLKHRLIYIPVPKNACSSTKEALYEIQFARRFNKRQPDNDVYLNIHDYYKKRPKAFIGVKTLSSANNFTKFAIVRDPVERLISCYRNRVIDLEELKEAEPSLQKLELSALPDLNTFVLNLKKYRKVSKSIEHHSRHQASFFGNNLKYLDKIFPIEEIDELQQFLKTYHPDLKFLKQKSGGTSFSVSDLSDEAMTSAVKFYRQDYQLLANYYSPKTHLNRRINHQEGS